MNDERIDLSNKFSTPTKIYQTLKQGKKQHREYKYIVFSAGLYRMAKGCGEYASEEAHRNIIQKRNPKAHVITCLLKMHILKKHF